MDGRSPKLPTTNRNSNDKEPDSHPHRPSLPPPIHLIIPMEPMGAPRHRIERTKSGKVKTYNLTKYRDWKGTFAMIAATQMPASPSLDMPLSVEILAIFDRPAYMCKRYKRSGALKGSPGLVWHVNVPDADNVIKAVLDALKDHMTDDRIVADVRCRKHYREIDGKPRVEVIIQPLLQPCFGGG